MLPKSYGLKPASKQALAVGTSPSLGAAKNYISYLVSKWLLRRMLVHATIDKQCGEVAEWSKAAAC